MLLHRTDVYVLQTSLIYTAAGVNEYSGRSSMGQVVLSRDLELRSARHRARQKREVEELKREAENLEVYCGI